MKLTVLALMLIITLEPKSAKFSLDFPREEPHYYYHHPHQHQQQQQQHHQQQQQQQPQPQQQQQQQQPQQHHHYPQPQLQPQTSRHEYLSERRQLQSLPLHNPHEYRRQRRQLQLQLHIQPQPQPQPRLQLSQPPSPSPNLNVAQHGIIFEKMGKINLITAFHNLVISFNTAEVMKAAQRLNDIMRMSYDLVRKEKYYLNSYFSMLLENIIKKFNLAFNRFKKYIEASSYQLNAQDQLENIIATVEFYSQPDQRRSTVLEEEEEEEGKEAPEQATGDISIEDDSSPVKVLNQYVSLLNAKDSFSFLSKIAEAIYRANITFRVLEMHYLNQSHPLYYNVTRELVMSHSLSFFEFCVRDFSEEIERLLYLLDSILVTSKTSALLITPEYFKLVLRNLQNTWSLLYPPTDLYLPQYYAVCRSVVQKKGDELYFVIQIPIKSTYDYELYHLHYIPLPISNLPSWSRKFDFPRQNYLAVSSTGDEYTFLDNLATSCFSLDNKICTASQPIRKRRFAPTPDNCLLSSFHHRGDLADEDANKCIFAYERNRDIEFIRIGNYWFGSILEEAFITQKCPPHSSRVYSFNRSVIMLPITGDCIYVSDRFTLPLAQPTHNNNNNNNNNKENIKIILSPIRIDLPPLVITELFLNREIKRLTTWDINIFQASSESKTFINSSLNFSLLIFLLFYIVIITCVVSRKWLKTPQKTIIPIPRVKFQRGQRGQRGQQQQQQQQKQQQQQQQQQQYCQPPSQQLQQHQHHQLPPTPSSTLFLSSLSQGPSPSPQPPLGLQAQAQVQAHFEQYPLLEGNNNNNNHHSNNSFNRTPNNYIFPYFPSSLSSTPSLPPSPPPPPPPPPPPLPLPLLLSATLKEEENILYMEMK